MTANFDLKGKAMELSYKAIEIAAQCWCDEETQMIEMDIRLAAAFAKRLDNDYAAIAELTERNLKLRADLEVAISALERLTNPELTIGHMHIARQALEKVREK